MAIRKAPAKDTRSYAAQAHRRAARIAIGMEKLLERSLTDPTAEQRKLCFALLQASLHVAVSGETCFSKEISKRLYSWIEGQKKPILDDIESFTSVYLVKASRAPKSRVAKRGQTAFEEAARQQRVSPSTVERRYYKRTTVKK